MRRTHASLMRELKVDPKVVADQLGHSVDVNLNVYSKTALGLRKEAVDALERSLEHPNSAESPSRIM
jgi:integrase